MFLIQFLHNFHDIAKEVCIPFVIAIFAFAFPLLFTSAKSIDEKYKSTILVELYRQEFWLKIFCKVIIAALFAILVYILCGFLNPLIEYFAVILLFLITIGLVTSTFLLIRQTYIYFVPKKLFNRLKEQCEKDDNEQIFQGVSQLMYYSINQADESLARDVMQFFLKSFSDLIAICAKKLQKHNRF